MNLSVYKLRYNTEANTKIPTPHHLITNLAHRLKLHHKRNQYLKARLDTCANVNIMPANVYKLVFLGPDCKKHEPSKLEIGTYTTNKVKLVGSWMVYHGTSRYQIPTASNVLCGQ